MLALIICIIAIGLMICLVTNERSKKNQSFNEDSKENTRNSSTNDLFVLYCLYDLFK